MTHHTSASASNHGSQDASGVQCQSKTRTPSKVRARVVLDERVDATTSQPRSTRNLVTHAPTPPAPMTATLVLCLSFTREFLRRVGTKIATAVYARSTFGRLFLIR